MTSYQEDAKVELQTSSQANEKKPNKRSTHKKMKDKKDRDRLKSHLEMFYEYHPLNATLKKSYCSNKIKRPSAGPYLRRQA